MTDRTRHRKVDLSPPGRRRVAVLWFHISLRTLRWLATGLPILFLILVDVVRQGFLADPLQTPFGALILYILTGAAVVAFSSVVFGFIEALERGLIEQNRQLAALNSLAAASSKNLRLDELLSDGAGSRGRRPAPGAPRGRCG